MLLLDLMKCDHVPHEFKRAPDDWRGIVKCPMSIETMLQRLDGYNGIDGLVSDFSLVCANVSVFYTPQSVISAFALALRDLFRLTVRGITDVEDFDCVRKQFMDGVLTLPVQEPADEDMTRQDLLQLQEKLTAMVGLGRGRELKDLVMRLLPGREARELDLTTLPISALRALTDELDSLLSTCA